MVKHPKLKAEGFSKRQMEVIELVAAGLTDIEIGEKLFIEGKSTRYHLSNIYKKVGSIRGLKIHRPGLIAWCNENKMLGEETNGIPE